MGLSLSPLRPLPSPQVPLFYFSSALPRRFEMVPMLEPEVLGMWSGAGEGRCCFPWNGKKWCWGVSGTRWYQISRRECHPSLPDQYTYSDRLLINSASHHATILHFTTSVYIFLIFSSSANKCSTSLSHFHDHPFGIRVLSRILPVQTVFPSKGLLPYESLKVLSVAWTQSFEHSRNFQSMPCLDDSVLQNNLCYT